MRVIVNKDQVQVGFVTQFLAAQFAIRDDGKAGDFTMFLACVRPAQIEHMAQHQVGQIAQVIAEFFQRQQVLQIHGEQVEDLLLLDVAQAIHLAFHVVFAIGQARADVRVDALPVGRSIDFSGIEQLIEQRGVQSQIFSRPATRGDQFA